MLIPSITFLPISLPFPSRQVPAFETSPSLQNQQCLVSISLFHIIHSNYFRSDLCAICNQLKWLSSHVHRLQDEEERMRNMFNPSYTLILMSGLSRKSWQICLVYSMVSYGQIFKQKTKWTTLTKTAKPCDEKKKTVSLWQTPSIRKLSLPG